MAAREAYEMEEVRQDAYIAELQGWQAGFALVLMTRGNQLPNKRSQWREIRAVGIQRYREEWMGEHEILSETGWLNGWGKGWAVASWIRNSLDTNAWVADKARNDVQNAIGEWVKEREAATLKPRPRRKTQPKAPK